MIFSQVRKLRKKDMGQAASLHLALEESKHTPILSSGPRRPRCAAFKYFSHERSDAVYSSGEDVAEEMILDDLAADFDQQEHVHSLFDSIFQAPCFDSDTASISDTVALSETAVEKDTGLIVHSLFDSSFQAPCSDSDTYARRLATARHTEVGVHLSTFQSSKSHTSANISNTVIALTETAEKDTGLAVHSALATTDEVSEQSDSDYDPDYIA